jgi:BirA family biotin operon repressor/biotin-[acetyl-CoA-carboxylase] ligase
MLTLGHPFEILSEVDSTNNYIADHPHIADMSEGTAILTYNQTKGRGQRQRGWHMQKDEDLAVSYLLRPAIGPDLSFGFNKLMAIGVRDCIASYTSGQALIKWPNDIYVEGKKVAGILIEPAWQGNLCRHMIVGVGINVNSDVDRSQWNAVSLYQLGGIKIAMIELLNALSQSLSKQYHRMRSKDLELVDADFNKYLFGMDAEVMVEYDGSIRKASLLGVDTQGQLVIKDKRQVSRHQHGTITVDYSGVKSK